MIEPDHDHVVATVRALVPEPSDGVPFDVIAAARRRRLRIRAAVTAVVAAAAAAAAILIPVALSSRTAPAGGQQPTAAVPTREAHWDKIAFRYPEGWEVRDFHIRSAGPATLGPYLANRRMHDPCAADSSCSGPPVDLPASAGTVWAEWFFITLATPAPAATGRIDVIADDHRQTCADAGTPLGSFTATWTISPVTEYRLHACYTRQGAGSAVATLRAIVATVTSPVFLPARAASVSVRPQWGPVGTTVRLAANNCADLGSVSFNNDANDPSARNDPKTVHQVAATVDGDRASGSYTIARSDLTGGEGVFYVQCGARIAQATFLVTGPVRANGQCPLDPQPPRTGDGGAAYTAAVDYATALDHTLKANEMRLVSAVLASQDRHGRGGQVHCGSTVAARTFVVSTTRMDMGRSASLSEGVYFVSRVDGRMTVWQQAH